jgi:hypothetical protein
MRTNYPLISYLQVDGKRGNTYVGRGGDSVGTKKVDLGSGNGGLVQGLVQGTASAATSAVDVITGGDGVVSDGNEVAREVCFVDRFGDFFALCFARCFFASCFFALS